MVEIAARPPFDLDDSSAEHSRSSEVGESNELSSPRQENTSDASEEELAAQRRRDQIRSDRDLVLNWLLANGVRTLDSDLFDRFKNALDQKVSEGDHAEENRTLESERLNETAELLAKLPELFKQVDAKITELKDQAGYHEIGAKRVEIIKGICEPVLNGHLTAGDMETLVQGIEIVSRNDPERQAQFVSAGLRSGYDGVMFFSMTEQKIYLFAETLVDDFKNSDGRSVKLNIRHMITHELSHNIVERTTKYNQRLFAKTNEIIENAQEIKNSQSQHIKNSLEGVITAETDFERYFANSIATSEAFMAVPEDQKGQVREAEKTKFVNRRKLQAAAEILTEYTAMYLQSDGNFSDFVLNCLKKSDLSSTESYFNGEIDSNDLSETNNANDPIKKASLLERLERKSPRFATLVDIYQTFYSEIRNETLQNKGKYFDIQEDEDEDPFADLDETGLLDSSSGFQQDSQPGGTPAQASGNSFWKEFGAFIAALSQEIPGGSGSSTSF